MLLECDTFFIGNVAHHVTKRQSRTIKNTLILKPNPPIVCLLIVTVPFLQGNTKSEFHLHKCRVLNNVKSSGVSFPITVSLSVSGTPKVYLTKVVYFSRRGSQANPLGGCLRYSFYVQRYLALPNPDWVDINGSRIDYLLHAVTA